MHLVTPFSLPASTADEPWDQKFWGLLPAWPYKAACSLTSEIPNQAIFK